MPYEPIEQIHFLNINQMADKHDHQCEHHHNDEELIKKIKELPLKERVKVAALFHYTKKKEVLDNELEAKIKSLQRDYDLKALPIYDSQNELISGKRVPTAEELTDLKTYFKEEESTEEFVANTDPLEGFWGKAIGNCQEIQDRINPDGKNEKDSEVLAHLTRVQVIYTPSSDDFTLKFTFRENEFFTNTELTKTFHFKAPAQPGHDHDHHHHGHAEEEEDFPIKTVGTEIQWKEGKNITKKVVQKKQKNKKTGQSRTVNKTVDANSFFNFFRSTTFEDKENLDDEAADELDEKMETDYEIGRNFTDELIPYSLEYYLGINPENDDEFDDVDEEEDDDKDKDEDDDSEDDKKKKKSNRKKSGDSSKAKKAKDAPKEAAKEGECKQQ